MSITWGSPPQSPEDRTASRNAINGWKSMIHNTLSNLRPAVAKEDYDPAKQFLRDGLSWLKANPTTSADDIGDYMNDQFFQSPFIQSIQVRKTYYTLAATVTTELNNRLMYLQNNHPELVSSAQDLITPITDYRDEILAWLENGRMTLTPDDYNDKTDDIKEKAFGADGTEDNFNLKILMDDKKLTPVLIQQAVDDQADANTFSITRLLKKIVAYVTTGLLCVLFVWGFFLGACYSTNENIGREFPYRVFYAIYGALFWLIVVPYELLYKKWWLNKPTELHGYIPLVNGPVENWWWIGKTFFFFLERKENIDMKVGG
jgi:hypothetical protein